MPATEPHDLELPGPWQHRTVTANGVRLHLAEAGSGPLVVLLHGFPQLWWAWRNQLPALADAGYHAVAVDLRGFGGSDKPPRSYDPVTTSGDVAGLIRALGYTEATVVGQEIGGMIGWALAALHPGIVRGLGVVSAAHPRRWRREMVLGSGQRNASAHVFRAQPPRLPEARLVRDDGLEVERLIRAWAGPMWRDTADFAHALEIYRAAIQVPQAAYAACEYYRWQVRSLIRPDGFAFVGTLRRRVQAPVLQLHGDLDTCVLPSTAAGSGAYVRGAYEYRLMPACGHFPAEERPDLVNAALLGWLETLQSPDPGGPRRAG